MAGDCTGGFVLTQDRARQSVPEAKTRRQAETQRRGREEGKIVIHWLRHTFTTTLLRLSVNVKVVSDDLEEQPRSCLDAGDVAELVEDEEVVAFERPAEAPELPP
jgi:hypothetical protein